jgi:porin
MKREPTRLNSLLAAVLTTLAPVTTLADEAPYAGTLTGDWNGARSAWQENGVSVDLGLKVDWLRNRRGGSAQGEQTHGLLDINLGADLEKLWGWQGATALLNVIGAHGGKLNGRYVASNMGVDNIEVGTSSTHIFQAWVEQRFADDRAALLVGIYPVDTEFSVMESAGLFLHPAFGASADFAASSTPSIYSVSTFGARARLTSADESLYAMGAVLDGRAGHPTKLKGTQVHFQSGDGQFVIAEAGWMPEAAKPEADRAAFGKFALGAWTYTSTSGNQDTNGTAVDKRQSGAYLLGEKTLWRESAEDAQGLGGFVRVSRADGRSSAVRSAVNLGLTYQGIVPGRDNDVVGLGLSRARFSEPFFQGTVALANETAVELTYRLQVNDALAVQPLLQRIRRPFDGGTIWPDATVAGVRLELAL